VIKNSTTILLPHWIQLLEDLENDASLSNPLAIWMMPHWNLTYNMIIFALEYHLAIDEISGDRDIRKYELLEEEWELVQQLCDVLGV